MYIYIYCIYLYINIYKYIQYIYCLSETMATVFISQRKGPSTAWSMSGSKHSMSVVKGRAGYGVTREVLFCSHDTLSSGLFPIFTPGVELGADQRSPHVCSHGAAAVHLFGQQAHHQSDRTGSDLPPPPLLSSPLLTSTSTSGTLHPPASLGSCSATCALTDSRPTEA